MYCLSAKVTHAIIIWKNSRMPIKHTPEHPVVVASVGTLGIRGHLDNLLGVVVLDGVVAGDLDYIIAQDALASVDHEGRLIVPQLFSGLLRREHFEDVVATPVCVLRDGAVADKSARVQLVGANHQHVSGRESSSTSSRGRGGSVGRVLESSSPVETRSATIRIPRTVAHEPGDDGHGEAAEVHG